MPHSELIHNSWREDLQSDTKKAALKRLMYYNDQFIEKGAPSIEQLAQILEIPAEENHYFSLLMTFDPNAEMSSSLLSPELREKIECYVADQFRRLGSVFYRHAAENMVMVVSHSGRHPHILKEAEELAELLIKEIKKAESISASFILSRSFNELEGCHTAFNEIRSTYEYYKYTQASGSVLTYEYFLRYANNTDFAVTQACKQLKYYLRTRDFDGAIDYLNMHCLPGVVYEPKYSAMLIRLTLLVNAIYEGIELLRPQLREQDCSTLRDRCTDIYIDSPVEVTAQLISIIKDAEEITRLHAYDSSQSLMQMICDDVRDHFTDSSMSLDYLASKYNISVPHLSRAFKQFTGDNLSSMLQELRIKKAKTLLKETTMTISKISGSVGYDHTSSFIRAFQRSEGISPQKYRNET